MPVLSRLHIKLQESQDTERLVSPKNFMDNLSNQGIGCIGHPLG